MQQHFFSCSKKPAPEAEKSVLEQNWIDYEANTVSIAPEKDSNLRIFHISQKLIGMLRNLPKGYDKYVFSRPDMLP